MTCFVSSKAAFDLSNPRYKGAEFLNKVEEESSLFKKDHARDWFLAMKGVCHALYSTNCHLHALSLMPSHVIESIGQQGGEGELYWK